MQKITPNLWFKGNAKEAVDFYLSVFPDGRIVSTTNYPTEGLADFQKEFAGKPLVIDFEILGQRFSAINAGPEFTFNEAISFLITCEDQKEIDYYWSKLSANPQNEMCGWCKDKYGLSWQIVPGGMDEMIKKPGAFQKMMSMKKIIIADF